MSDSGGLSNAVRTSKGKDVSHLDDLLEQARTEETESQSSTSSTKRFNVNIPAELHNYIKVQAAKENRSMKDIFLDAIEMYLSSRSA